MCAWEGFLEMFSSYLKKKSIFCLYLSPLFDLNPDIGMIPVHEATNGRTKNNEF
jgi:hypothetical protein